MDLEKEQSTTQKTTEFIKSRPNIKSCLKKGLINYSALSRLVAQELNITKKTSHDAILIAARRYREQLKREDTQEKHIHDILAQSEIEIKNKIAVCIIEKIASLDRIEIIQKTVRRQNGIFYLLEGSGSYVIISQETHIQKVESSIPQKVIKSTSNLALINFKSPKTIETTPGVVAYLASLFSEHGVNIIELLSVWTDTLFVIHTKDIHKALEFLKF